VISISVAKTHSWAQLTLSLRSFVGVAPLWRYGDLPHGIPDRGVVFDHSSPVAIALGNWLAASNTPDSDAIGELVAALSDEDPGVAETAAWALRCVGGKAVRDRLPTAWP
jgi:hypothetical protein